MQQMSPNTFLISNGCPFPQGTVADVMVYLGITVVLWPPEQPPGISGSTRPIQQELFCREQWLYESSIYCKHCTIDHLCSICSLWFSASQVSIYDKWLYNRWYHWYTQMTFGIQHLNGYLSVSDAFSPLFLLFLRLWWLRKSQRNTVAHSGSSPLRLIQYADDILATQQVVRFMSRESSLWLWLCCF